MSLDERYGCSVSLSPLFRGKPLPAAQCMLLQPAYSGPLFIASRSWSLTASYSTGPQIRNRCALLFLGSPGAWFFAGQIGQGLNSYPVKGTLGHLLSSPARRIPDRWSASHWLTRLGRSPHSPQSLTKRESGGKESKAKYCPEFELKGMVCG